LTDDELGPLYDLLIDEPPMIRRAIGELVYDHLIAQNIKNSQAGAKGIVPLVNASRPLAFGV
jgi:cohesin complex subunit SA-1/2